MKKKLALLMIGVLACALATPAFAANKKHHRKHHKKHHHAAAAQAQPAPR
jgi:hypothetical protein